MGALQTLLLRFRESLRAHRYEPALIRNEAGIPVDFSILP